jgi:hypothetical protein
MNGTAANGNATCVFSSISQVLYDAEIGSLNITKVVQICPNICLLAYGTGNPDLSGVGVSQTCPCILEPLTKPHLAGKYLVHSPGGACCHLRSTLCCLLQSQNPRPSSA